MGLGRRAQPPQQGAARPHRVGERGQDRGRGAAEPDDEEGLSVQDEQGEERPGQGTYDGVEGVPYERRGRVALRGELEEVRGSDDDQDPRGVEVRQGAR